MRKTVYCFFVSASARVSVDGIRRRRDALLPPTAPLLAAPPAVATLPPLLLLLPAAPLFATLVALFCCPPCLLHANMYRSGCTSNSDGGSTSESAAARAAWAGVDPLAAVAAAAVCCCGGGVMPGGADIAAWRGGESGRVRVGGEAADWTGRADGLEPHGTSRGNEERESQPKQPTRKRVQHNRHT